jgi:hypothetical protein
MNDEQIEAALTTAVRILGDVLNELSPSTDAVECLAQGKLEVAKEAIEAAQDLL